MAPMVTLEAKNNAFQTFAKQGKYLAVGDDLGCSKRKDLKNQIQVIILR